MNLFMKIVLYRAQKFSKWPTGERKNSISAIKYKCRLISSAVTPFARDGKITKLYLLLRRFSNYNTSYLPLTCQTRGRVEFLCPAVSVSSLLNSVGLRLDKISHESGIQICGKMLTACNEHRFFNLLLNYVTFFSTLEF